MTVSGSASVRASDFATEKTREKHGGRKRFRHVQREQRAAPGGPSRGFLLAEKGLTNRCRIT
ncbi:hypothetical protein, partial [Streptomyces sp. NPDC005167]